MSFRCAAGSRWKWSASKPAKWNTPSTSTRLAAPSRWDRPSPFVVCHASLIDRRHKTIVCPLLSRLLCFARVFHHAARQVVLDLRVVACRFVVCRLQQRVLAGEQRVADTLLHARIVQFALPG